MALLGVVAELLLFAPIAGGFGILSSSGGRSGELNGELADATSLLDEMRAQQVGIGGYASTGDEGFLESYARARPAADRALGSLRGRTAHQDPGRRPLRRDRGADAGAPAVAPRLRRAAHPDRAGARRHLPARPGGAGHVGQRRHVGAGGGAGGGPVLARVRAPR